MCRRLRGCSKSQVVTDVRQGSCMSVLVDLEQLLQKPSDGGGDPMLAQACFFVVEDLMLEGRVCKQGATM